jgi:hypothetical protein
MSPYVHSNNWQIHKTLTVIPDFVFVFVLEESCLTG